jgi:Zn finger protein HypA/HybF involved in hydrogenase expression
MVRRKEEIDIECNNCKNIFKKKKGKLKRSIKHFCTNNCKQTYYRNNPHERGVYSGHNGRSAVVSYRIKAFQNYEHKCHYCNYNRYVDVLQVHHLDENRNNNALENLRIVCPTCHSEIHKHYR